MKIFEISFRGEILKEADLTVIKLSLFSSLKDLENWISQADLSKSGTIILVSDTCYSGDMTKISQYIDGQSSNIEDVQMLYDVIHGVKVENLPYMDEYTCYGVPIEEFEEHLKQAALNWDDPKKRDDGSTC